MKKIAMLYLLVLFVFVFVGCEEEEVDPKVTYYEIVFSTDGGTDLPNQTIEENGFVLEPSDPSKEGYNFLYWYVDDANIEYLFSTPVTSDLTLTALWEEDVVIEQKTPEERIQEDIDALESSIYVSRYLIDTPRRGPVNNSLISWSSNSKYISKNGIILPLLPGDTEEGSIKARFTLDGVVVNHLFEVELSQPDPVQIATERVIPFENLTTEYDVDDKEVTILYEENGNVPYIKVSDFFAILEGFIDPQYELDFDTDETTLTVSYDYLDEEENQDYLDGKSDFDGWYHLTLIIDTVENTITTPDPGFYWAYVYSTATNYGRHIEYDRDNENAYYSEGDDLVYDLDDYNMDIVMYEGEAVLPYYIANQLFAGVSYYNVYYNFDGLYGIYSLPSYGSDESIQMRESSTNNEDIPADLVAHTFNYLAFSFNEFYGTQEIMGVENYYDKFFERKDQFLTTDPVVFDDILFDFISKDIDEPHTSYGYPGYYNDSEYYGPRLSSLEQLGPRVNSFYVDGLYAVDDEIAEKWNIGSSSSWSADHPNRPSYWFLDEAKTAVVLSLDNFNTSDIEESMVYDGTIMNGILEYSGNTLVPNVLGGNKFFYYNNSTQQYKLAEVLIKGLDDTYKNSYVDELISAGYVYDETSSIYTKVIDDNQYHVKVQYDSQFELLYIGVMKTELVEDLDNFTEEITDLIEADSAVYMEMYLELITKEHNKLDSVILDLTFNTGGNVGALYRVLGFVTTESFAVASIDADTNSNSISYVRINGVPDYSYLNWGILQSPATFSAANEMSTIFKQNNLGVVIGTVSGGGASSITPILLPNGSAFTMSSNSINAYAVETGNPENPYEFISNEFGIEPDVELLINQIYDNQLLLNALNDFAEQD